MRKEEYINEVISKIENKKARAEVERELSDHIDDRISYYIDAGWDEETANAHAIEHMGEPRQVGFQMAKLHKGIKAGEYFALFLPVFFLLFCCVYSICRIAFEREIAGSLFIFEVFFFLTLLLLSDYGRKMYSKLLATGCFLSYLLYFILNIALMFVPVSDVKGNLYSAVVLNYVLAFAGELDAAANVPCYFGVRPVWWVVILTLIFFTVVLAVLLINMLCVCDMKKAQRKVKRLSDKLGKVSFWICIACGVMIIQLIVLFVIGNTSNLLHPKNITQNVDADKYYILESDEPTDLFALASNFTIIDWEFGWQTHFKSVSMNDYRIEEGSFRYTTETHRGVFRYSVCNADLEYKPSMDYVYVLPVEMWADTCKYDYDPENWLKTNEKHILSFEDSTFKGSVINLTIDEKEQ